MGEISVETRLLFSPPTISGAVFLPRRRWFAYGSLMVARRSRSASDFLNGRTTVSPRDFPIADDDRRIVATCLCLPRYLPTYLCDSITNPEDNSHIMTCPSCTRVRTRRLEMHT